VQEETKMKRTLEGPLITKEVMVNYAFDSERSKDLTDLAKTLKLLVSNREGANISVVSRTNTLILTDTAENVARLEEVIKRLDQKSPQITITAKIVEVDADVSHEWGVKWGGNYRQDNFTATGSGLTGGTGISGSDSVLNLPAAIAPGSGGAADFMIGKIGEKVLDVEISVMEQNGHGRVLATPRVITQDNQSAMIESGYEVPYQTIGEAGSFSIEFKEAVVSLKVTPHVIEDQIFMDVEIKRDRVDFTTATGSNTPPLLTKRLNTKVLVASGETVMIGGLIDHENTERTHGIPFLSRIPVLGWLFKNQDNRDNKKELIIFITPSLLRETVKEEA
jgi:type IV pilus assembly protein PilQ